MNADMKLSLIHIQLLINDLKKWYPDSDVDENVYIEVLNQLADKIISYMKIPDEKAVSYTHLDVYKRQMHSTRGIQEGRSVYGCIP